MDSSGRRQNVLTTTSTNTTMTVTQHRQPRTNGQSHNPSSSTSSRIPLVPINHDVLSAPQIHENGSHRLEPFPSVPAENSPELRMSRTDTRDHYPASQPVSRVSTRTPAVGSSMHTARRPIGIKRLSSNTGRLLINNPELNSATNGRRRSESAPQRPTSPDVQDGAPLDHVFTTRSNMPALVEGQATGRFQGTEHHHDQQEPHDPSTGIVRSKTGSQRMRRVSDAAKSAVSRMSGRSDEPAQPTAEYDDRIVDVLDVLDPEVSTLTTLTNVQNSLFVPDLGRWLNRRPTYELTQGPSYRSQRPTLNRGSSKPLPPAPLPGPPPLKDADLAIPSDVEEESSFSGNERRESLVSIASVVQEERYAVLPHGVSLDGWSEEDKELLDDHVRHMLHSKREGFKRSMRAFGKYVRKPLGFLVTLYAVLITLFGLAWVLFLIGWIYVGEQQLYIINVIDYVLVALFAIVGDGMAPFRAVDTYHMSFIAHYHRLTKKIRKQRALPKLEDQNELPEVHESEVDVEASLEKGDSEFSVLTPEQQKKLEHHQQKFSKSHSFYKPHETTTHHAFPHHLFVAIVILLDLHSCLQISLGATTWGIDYRTRPKAVTPTILSISITVNITAGILIKIGDNKTRKKDVLERMFRQELTKEAMKRVEKQKERESTPSSDTEIDRKAPEKIISKDRVREEGDGSRSSREAI